jgi:hypothetical protein
MWDFNSHLVFQQVPGEPSPGIRKQREVNRKAQISDYRHTLQPLQQWCCHHLNDKETE